MVSRKVQVSPQGFRRNGRRRHRPAKQRRISGVDGTDAVPAEELERSLDKSRRAWAKQAAQYDKAMVFFERYVFGSGHRQWACSRALGRTLEVGVGTGLNLPHYPQEVGLTGIDLSPEMLGIARERAASSGRVAVLREADAHRLPFGDAAFDSVVSTYSLCNIRDPRKAVVEMKRVLRAGGRLILVDHIGSSVGPIFWFQKVIEFFSRRVDGEHMTRRPLEHVVAEGFEVQERDRMRAGVVERLLAIKAQE